MIVVDSAAVVDVLTNAPGCEALRAHLAAEELHAPALLDFEFVSALRGLTLACQLSAGRAQDALTDFEHLPIHRWTSGDALRRRAYSLRDNLSAYDAAYVALAEALRCALVTRDGRLVRSSGHSVSIVVL
ncbi:MAG TPA: type II toxin-antitoxin system VapC family toxin [Solirubrobacter sp.]|nr:type II toxin-antitoxin system VapC family toxin [Solirubrobacter sp.]